MSSTTRCRGRTSMIWRCASSPWKVQGRAASTPWCARPCRRPDSLRDRTRLVTKPPPRVKAGACTQPTSITSSAMDQYLKHHDNPSWLAPAAPWVVKTSSRTTTARHLRRAHALALPRQVPGGVKNLL